MPACKFKVAHVSHDHRPRRWPCAAAITFAPVLQLHLIERVAHAPKRRQTIEAIFMAANYTYYYELLRDVFASRKEGNQPYPRPSALGRGDDADHAPHRA